MSSPGGLGVTAPPVTLEFEKQVGKISPFVYLHMTNKGTMPFSSFISVHKKIFSVEIIHLLY